MKSLLVLGLILGGLVLSGCGCHENPNLGFIGASGWPSEMVPLDYVPPVN